MVLMVFIERGEYTKTLLTLQTDFINVSFTRISGTM